MTSAILDREEHVEQAYFFRVFRERFSENQATQEVLERVHQEILATTRLPFAIQFLAAEMKHSGLLSSGFARLPHYFTAFQTFIIRATEEEQRKFSMDTALLILRSEAEFRAGPLKPSGLFMYQFEVIARNKLGYDQGLEAMTKDPAYDDSWREYIDFVRRQVGVVDFADLVYLRSELYVTEQRKLEPSYQPPVAPLLGEKEGKIAKAHRNRDPLYLFAALQRQLGYPEVPRARPVDDLHGKILTLQARLREMEMRLKLLEGEVRGQLDLSEFTSPEALERLRQRGDD